LHALSSGSSDQTLHQVVAATALDLPDAHEYDLAMIFRPILALLIPACLLAFPSHAPAPQVYRPGEGWIYEPAGGSSAFPKEVVLQQEVLPYGLESVYWNIYCTNTPFPKEPELSSQGVFRGVLRFGSKDTNNAIALIWDQPKSKLYLDLNRNLDLTDDPAGVFGSANKGSRQIFAQVPLALPRAAGLHPAILDFQLTSDGAGRRIQAQLSSRSVWQAKLGIAGEEWQVAVVDDVLRQDGPAVAQFLLLRPWAARTNQLVLRDYNTGIVRFPDRLFWLGQAFHLERRFETQGETLVCKLGLTPQQPSLTELKMSGESLYYAVLCATNGYTAVLWEPRGTLKVPQGMYTVSAVWLKKGAAEAFRLPAEPLLINATIPTTLVLGGPLTNSVTLSRQGRKLNMNYQLVGADGGSYRIAQQDRTKPPEFAVYHGGKKVLSGRFEFG
jgi:hypothetical protein